MTQHSRCCSCSSWNRKSHMLVFLLVVVVGVARVAGEVKAPLSTSSRWVVDRAGERVKLACVTWAGHLEPGIPEGLSRNTAAAIAALVAASGFNCVRFTSSTALWADDSYGSLTVAQSLNNLNLEASGVDLAARNPEYYLLSIREVHQRVVEVVTSQGLMVVLDNEVSKPQWCCEDSDGNGFWGDDYFDVTSWLRGLTAQARAFRTNSLVVAIGLRSELRGPRQNGDDWKVLITQAAVAVHDANPDVLLVAGGLSSATDLSFLQSSPLDTTRFQNKLVYAFHWYEGSPLELQSSNGTSTFSNSSDAGVCIRVQSSIHASNGFLVEQGTAPLLLSEFGLNLNNAPSVGETRFLDCVLDYLQQVQLDWALWALQGSYYVRHGQPNADEPFGLLTSSWLSLRNPTVLARLQVAFYNSSKG